MRRLVYLAGPVEKSEDPESWRDELVDAYQNIHFINPLDAQFDPIQERHEMIRWCLRQVQLSDFILVNYIEGVETYGTPMEVIYAWLNGTPVMTWSIENIEDMPQFLVGMSDAISDDVDELIDEGYQYKLC